MTGVVVSKAIHLRKPALRVTWTTPQSDVTISQYQVEYRRLQANWSTVIINSTGSAIESILLDTLNTSTLYQVRIRAVSAIGIGMWSRVASNTTYMCE